MYVLFRGSLWQRARLVSGLVLFAFAFAHFTNHALGLVGIEAMAHMQHARIAVTRSLPGSIILATALIVHMALGLARLAERRTWRMPAMEALQIVSGLLIPFLLFEHIALTRFAELLNGSDDSYAVVVPIMWFGNAFWQSAMLLLVWVHGCIGIHMWLRLAPWYRLIGPGLVVIAVALPVLAIAGFAVAGRDTLAALGDGATADVLLSNPRRPDATATALLQTWTWAALALFSLPLLSIAGVRLMRRLGTLAGHHVQITYTAGPTVLGPMGATLLEISRICHVPHAAACGGRSRCSTCRVRIDAGDESLPPPTMPEATTLGSIGAPAGVRLACQIRPSLPLTITRLVSPATAMQRRSEADDEASGVERRLAVMFLDVRGFTRLSEKRLPYDVVYLLNQFFGTVGAAIQAQGGWIDKYLGDGLLAVFGRETGANAGCRQALAAARDIDLALDALNARLANELGEQLKIGIGIHAGVLVVGHIGHTDTATITVVGSTVNAASRLESLTKEKGVQLIVSKATADAAGWNAVDFASDSVEVRGQSDRLDVILVPRARDLPIPAPAQ